MKVTRFHLAAFLIVLLGALLSLSGPARAQSQSDPGSVEGRAGTLTAYYNRVLSLTPQQYRPVYRATLQQVQALDKVQAQGVVTAAALDRIEEDFLDHVQSTLTVRQLSLLLALRTHQSADQPSSPIVLSNR
ncbi:hypothetical protein F0P96_00755 [Hymenobacter busanensis]|uniref:Uncharacterized protein n=1 Tax=Hymenobacter busanensis TaxID=2607656 RepID=A0A7L4ZW15_9BACT|nr:hypothetical protein [Hymenobacter busanensis]KAA9339192.1 hypothetical protein F0P96_00755 [Hymenobacter busanensis]QHJ07046.1 hypothetical protein GUY19_06995 [Hymenobacter busanensis]